MDKVARQRHARTLMNDDVLLEGFAYARDQITKELLFAKTPGDREQKWHEYHALERVRRRLATWATSPEK